MTPKLNGRDVPPGPWRSTTTRKPRFSTRVCPVCGFWLHQLLVDAGQRLHPLCAPPPRGSR